MAIHPFPDPGVTLSPEGATFTVWAPSHQEVEVMLENAGAFVALARHDAPGFFTAFVPDVRAGERYHYRLDNSIIFPDPASRRQPEGVHGPSEVVDPCAFSWTDAAWQGVPQRDLVFYELHVGSFSPEGTFDGVTDRLEYLRDLGVTAIELMPLAEFPGRHGWGYDHAGLFAPFHGYGAPDDLKRLINRAHELGLAVFLDVIYNHLGPDGSYVAAYGQMFTRKHTTPWGPAINLDDEGSAGVRHFLKTNALYWLQEFHFDGLRLDAIHEIKDDSPVHFLAELSEAAHALEEGPRRILIAEDHRNLNHVIRPVAEGGWGLDGMWIDDFHHLMRNITAGDQDGYFASFRDTAAHDLADTINRGWYYNGFKDKARGARRGTEAVGVRREQCVYCIQNHDQIGNRPLGDRLYTAIDHHTYLAASALVLFTEGLPLLFQGQEWGATTPFQFFSDHMPELGKLVSKGRLEEFKDFTGFGGDVPDPQDPATFLRSRLDWSEPETPPHGNVLQFYKDLLRLRKQLSGLPAEACALDRHTLTVRRGAYELIVVFKHAAQMDLREADQVILHTGEPRYLGEVFPTLTVRDGLADFAGSGALVARRVEASAS